MPEQREPGFYWVRYKGPMPLMPASYDGDGAWYPCSGFPIHWRDGGDERFKPFGEIGPRILPPSAAPSQPQPDRLDAVMSLLLDEIESGREWAAMDRSQRLAYLAFKAALGCSDFETDAFIRGRNAGESIAKMEAVAVAQKQDLVAPSVLDAEPGHPSNPAVERLTAPDRGLHEALAEYIAAVEEYDDDDGWSDERYNAALTRARAALGKAFPPTGPTNEGHGR